jgi:hypothetical protein
MPILAQEQSISASTMKRPMKLVDPHTGLMECAACGQRPPVFPSPVFPRLHV